jgi:5,10-methylenetetrahydromethanopterin reductase
MRIGVSLPEPKGLDGLTTLRAELQQAADDGFSSAWISNIFGVDALTALAVAGSAVPGIEVGTAVVPSYPRHPAVLAQQALTTSLATGGRLLLGIGLSHRLVIEDMYGYSFDRPARHMREYLSVLLPLLRGEQADFEGETLRAKIGLSTPRPVDRVPLLLAALAPAMLRLAGEQTDGTILWMTGPATVRDYVVPAITAAAKNAGRPDPRVVCVLPVCVTDDPDQARKRAERICAIYGQLPSYRAMLDREGYAGPEDAALIGSEETVTERLDELSAAGVDEFGGDLFDPSPEGRERSRACLRAWESAWESRASSS